MLEEAECRDVLDALACSEAVCWQQPASFLEGLRSECRHAASLQVGGFQSRRLLSCRGVSNSDGFRLLKAQILYSFEACPSPDSANHTPSPEIVLVYSFWGSSEVYEEATKPPSFSDHGAPASVSSTLKVQNVDFK